jgi:glycosyltransferase involved in cell wall biosynthesis
MLPLRFFGNIKKLIFYTIDYVPQRFPNPLLNWCYHAADRIACRYADRLWVLSPRMNIQRKKNGIKPEHIAPTVLLPMGANIDRIKPLPLSKITRHQLVFVGHLLKKQGVQLVIEILPTLIKKIPDVRIVIVGQGEYENTLKKLADTLGVSAAIRFLGFVEKHTDVEKLLCKSAIGLALYVPTADNYTYFADPGKPKIYLGCGLPTVITAVPHIATVIHNAQAGFKIAYRKHDLEIALTTLLTDDALYASMRANALRLAKEYNTNQLIAQAIENS